MSWLSAFQLLGFLLLFIGTEAMAGAPLLYRQPAYQSPVQGGPDDLLLLAGFGFAAGDTVIYRAVRDTTEPLAIPPSVPTDSGAEFGLASIVSSAAIPYSLTVKLPRAIDADQTYALWVHTARGEWSRAVMINDARPLWASPPYVYASGMPAALSREIKIVGRNLQPSAGRSTRIRLLGPERFAGTAVPGDAPARTLNSYVARVPLPDHLAPGSYRIEVSRDGASWVEIEGQSLDVRPDPAPMAQFSISDVRFGGCRPDDGLDDTACILRAIAAAKLAGGGEVTFGPGTWDLIDSAQPGLIGDVGIVVPIGVGLRGSGRELTRLERHSAWTDVSPAGAAFTLFGNTRVTGFTFHDVKAYQARDRAGPFLQLGGQSRVDSGANRPSATIDDVIITGNTFDKTMVGIGNAGLPVRRLFITHNTFGAFNSALELTGDRYDVNREYRLDDSVIDDNVFKPGSKLDLLEKTGTLASELGAGHRLDFSGNTADGSSTDYLYSPDDAKGWRAAFFWSLQGNSEQVLISQNSMTCTGDKIGDGEALAFDNNANTFALTEAAGVEHAMPASVTVSAPLVARQNERPVPISDYYIGHWVQVVSGPGRGQARKITGYATDTGNRTTTFRVAPDWDVAPIPGLTRIAVGREFWQLYVLDNQVDNRQPLCQKSNRSRRDAGGITLWAQSADSVIAGNRQYDSDGILVQQNYIVPEHACADCAMEGFFQSALDIRGNLVDGEYDWANDCSSSGIALGLAAAPWGHAPPPTVSLGVAVSYNVIRRADGLHGGAISQLDSWWSGPPPNRWPLSDNVIIQHNSIADIDGQRASAICGKGRPRMGIAFPDHEIAWRTVLYRNSCEHVSVPIGEGGVDAVRVCPTSTPASCECP
jgi:hypothetical protein